MSILKTFNEQLSNFAQVLVDRFPQKELRAALTGIDTLKSVNPKKNIELFVMYAYKYREIVMNRDEQALLNTNFVSEQNKLSNEENAVDIMNNLRQNWSSLDEDEKGNLWAYLKVLMTLSDRYIAESLNK